jgi:hypothetical protein
MKVDREPYKRIGRIIVKMLPKNWEKTVFWMEAKEDMANWSAKYSFLDTESGTQSEAILDLTPELLIELECLRRIPYFPTETCKVIFFSNGRFEMSTRNKSDIKQPNMNEVQQAIQDLKTLDLASTDIDVIKKRLGEIILGYKLISPTIPKDARLYRGVRWADKPTKIRELSYPPEKNVENFHRAGRAGKILFYCSTAREAPFFELGLRMGDRVAISQWKVKAELIVNNVGYDSEVFRALSSNRESPSWDKGTDFEKLEKTNAFTRHFFAAEFAKIVPPGQEYLYKISAALAELHFSDGMFAGLLYPAMAMRANADNLALKPECIDLYLELYRVEYLRVDESSEQGFKVTILDFADAFDQDDKIQWKGRHPHWVMRQSGQTLYFTVENGRWVARDEQSKLVEPE